MGNYYFFTAFANYSRPAGMHPDKWPFRDWA